MERSAGGLAHDVPQSDIHGRQGECHGTASEDLRLLLQLMHQGSHARCVLPDAQRCDQIVDRPLCHRDPGTRRPPPTLTSLISRHLNEQRVHRRRPGRTPDGGRGFATWLVRNPERNGLDPRDDRRGLRDPLTIGVPNDCFEDRLSCFVGHLYGPSIRGRVGRLPIPG